MRNVVFVAPFSFDTTRRFIEGAAAVPDVRLILLSQDPVEKFPADLRSKLGGHFRVGNALNPRDLVLAIEKIAKSVGPIHRVLGTLEQIQEQLAVVREQLDLPGMKTEAAENFRDKSRMKDVLRQAGLPCARHCLMAEEADAWRFIEEVGYPIVVKPPAGAGAKATFSVENADALRKALRQNPPHPQKPVLAEEFMQGSEHSFDGVSIDGELVWHSLTHYLPGPLEVMSNPWMQWCVLLPREVDDPAFDDIRKAAAATLDALGMETGVCHLEWFRRGDGSIAISEVAARPGGAQISKLISYAHDIDFYQDWARVMIDGKFDVPTREYAVGAAYLRGQGRGRVARIHGIEQAQQEIGPLVVETDLPLVGQSPSSSYEGDGYAILRHRDTAVVEKALHRLVDLVKVELG